MKTKNLKFFNLAEGPEYKTKKYSNNGCELSGGKPIYDCEELAKKTKQILGRFLNPEQVSRLLYRLGKQVKIGLKNGRLKKNPDGTIYEDPNKIEIEHALGNVFGVGGFNALAEEVQRLVLDGKTLRGRSHRLQQKYHLQQKGDVEYIKREFREAEECLKKLSPKEAEALQNLENLPRWSKKERQSCKEAQKKSRDAERKKRGLKPLIENRFEKSSGEISPEAYKKRFGHSLDSDGKEFEKSGYKRIRPGAGVFIFSGPSPSRASSAPCKAKEKTAEAQPQR